MCGQVMEAVDEIKKKGVILQSEGRVKQVAKLMGKNPTLLAINNCLAR